MHNKKAISPLIATVLLIGFTIALAAVIINWGQTFTKGIQEQTESTAQKQIACSSDVNINIKSATLIGNKIQLLIENPGEIKITKFLIRLIGSKGANKTETSSGLDPYGIGTFNAVLDPNTVGMFKEIEVFPEIVFKGEDVICNTKDTEDELQTDRDGLITYFKLDDASEGTPNGNPGFVDGVIGKAISLDGVDDYLRRPSSSGLPFGNSPRTVEAWIKPSGYPDGTYNGIFAYGLPACTKGSLLSIKNNGQLSMAFWCNDAYQTVGSGVTLNRWTHVAFTYSGGTTIKFYIDGNLVQESTLTGGAVDTSDGPIRLGCTDDPGRCFSGVIDEVRVYNKAKTY